MRGRIILAAGVATAMFAGPAGAQELVGRWFGRGECYSRVYNVGHLQLHPGQQVGRIWIGGRSGDARPSAREVNFGFALNGRPGGYGGLAVCRDRQISLACGVEGDGGGFRVSQAGGGDLQLTVVDRLQVEGERGASPELGRDQDRVFRLRRAGAGACRVER